MNYEKLFEKISEENEDKLNFNDILPSEKLHSIQKLCGFLYIASLLKPNERFEMHAEHDILYLAGENDMRELTNEDILYLLRCGIYWDSEFECLHMWT